MHDQHEAGLRNAADRLEMLREPDLEILEQAFVDRGGEQRQQQRVAVGRGARDHLGAEIAAGPGPVLDDELLAEYVAHALSDHPRQDVGRAAGCKSDHHPDRPGGIGALRQRCARPYDCTGSGAKYGPRRERPDEAAITSRLQVRHFVPPFTHRSTARMGMSGKNATTRSRPSANHNTEFGRPTAAR